MNFHRQPRLGCESLEAREVPAAMAASFDSGFWRWTDHDGWRKLADERPLSSSVQADGTVVAVLAGVKHAEGVHRWDAAGNWKHLTTARAQQIDVNAQGVIFGDFNADGLWRYSPTTNTWQQLTGQNPTRIEAPTNDGSVYGRFTNGIWRWTAGDGWQTVSSAPVADWGVADGVFYGTFYEQGVLSWKPNAGWTLLSYGGATRLPSCGCTYGGDVAVAEDGTLYVEFDPTYGPIGYPIGVWEWAPGTGLWSRVGVDNSTDLIATDTGVFVSAVGWGWAQYTSSTGTLSRVVHHFSDRVSLGDVASDGTLFTSSDPNWNVGGLWQRTPTGTYHRLSEIVPLAVYAD